jgi:hypothetical protein
VNSPDDALDAFDARIAEAARSLVRPAPAELLAQVKRAVHDADAAHAAAARALARPAPIPFEQVLARAKSEAAAAGDELSAFDARIADAARALVRPAPAHLLAAIRAAARATPAARRLRLVPRVVLAAAAALVAAVTLFFATRDGEAATSHPSLLTADALAQSERHEAALESRADRLAARVATDPAAAEDEALAPLLEEVAFVDAAIDECKDALALSQAHTYLREQLLQLTTQRGDLLAQVAERRR